MARYNGNESLGFDAFDRAYEPEIMSMYNSGDIDNLTYSVNAIDTFNSCTQRAPITYAYNDKGITLNTAVNTIADNTVSVVNNFDKLSKAIRKIAEMTGLEIDSDLNIIKKDEGYSKIAYSNKSKLSGVSRLSRSQLLTI